MIRLIISVSLLWVSAAKADPVINTNYQYYSINTTSVSQLLSDLNHASPIKINGKVFHGHADTNVQWNFRWERSNEKCKINTVSTTVAITYTLPKLISSDKNEGLHDLWNRWYPALVRHEKKHVQHAIKIANKIEAGILSVSPDSSCTALEKSANKVGRSFIKKLNELDRDYDTTTDNGRTEGAYLSGYL